MRHTAEATETVYEVRIGGEVMGQFTSMTKAQALKRQYSKEGKEARVCTTFVPVKKKTSVPKRNTPKDRPGGRPKDGPGPKVLISGRADGIIIRDIVRIAESIGPPYISMTSRTSVILSEDHVTMLVIECPSGTLFGFPESSDSIVIDCRDMSGRISPRDYDIGFDGSSVILGTDDKKEVIKAKTMNMRQRDPIDLDYDSVYSVDNVSFARELRRCSRLFPKGTAQYIRLYGDHGDLMMTAEDKGYGMDVDIGDGFASDGSVYLRKYLECISEMFRHSDGRCWISFGNDFPLEGRCSVHGIVMRMLVAPYLED